MIEFSSPSLRIGRADFPHPALQLMVHLGRGLTNLRMGNCQGVQAVLGKEGIRPAMMIETAGTPSSTGTMTKDAAQTHTDPAIQHDKGHAAAMLKVLKPSLQRPIHVQDDDRQAIAVGPLRFLADGVFEFPETLLSRPTLARFKVVSQKVKSSRLRRIDDSSLFRMQRQSDLRRPRLHVGQSSFRFRFTATQNDEVVRIAHHLEAAVLHLLVQRIQVNVRQQRTDDSPYAKDNLTFERILKYR